MMRFTDRDKTHEHVWDLRKPNALNRFCKNVSSMLLMAKRITKRVPIISAHVKAEPLANFSEMDEEVARQMKKIIQKLTSFSVEKYVSKKAAVGISELNRLGFYTK